MLLSWMERKIGRSGQLLFPGITERYLHRHPRNARWRGVDSQSSQPHDRSQLHEKGQSALLSTAGAPYFVENLSFCRKLHLYLSLWSFIYMFLCWCCVRCGRSRACNVVGAVCCKRANNMPYVRCKQNI